MPALPDLTLPPLHEGEDLAARGPEGLKPTCHYCGRHAQLVTGAAIYRGRPDLDTKYFWQCAACDAYVGCHPVGDGRVPLGRLANKELRQAKQRAHAAIDPHWQSGKRSRSAVYARLARLMGIPREQAHIGMFDVEQCALAQRLGSTRSNW